MKIYLFTQRLYFSFVVKIFLTISLLTSCKEILSIRSYSFQFERKLSIRSDSFQFDRKFSMRSCCFQFDRKLSIRSYSSQFEKNLESNYLSVRIILKLFNNSLCCFFSNTMCFGLHNLYRIGETKTRNVS